MYLIDLGIAFPGGHEDSVSGELVASSAWKLFVGALKDPE